VVTGGPGTGKRALLKSHAAWARSSPSPARGSGEASGAEAEALEGDRETSTRLDVGDRERMGSGQRP
jgi:hypothetical protein